MEKNIIDKLTIYLGINCLRNGDSMAWSYEIIDSDGVEHYANTGFTFAKPSNSLVMAADKAFLDMSFALDFVFKTNDVKKIEIHTNYTAITHLFNGTIYASEELYPNIQFFRNQIKNLKPKSEIEFIAPSGEYEAMQNADKASRMCIYNNKLNGWFDYSFKDFCSMAVNKSEFVKFVKANKFDKFKAYRDAESKKKMAFINRTLKSYQKTQVQATLQFLDGF